MALDQASVYVLAAFSLTCVAFALLFLGGLPLAALSWRQNSIGRSDILRSALYVNAVWTTLVMFILTIASTAVAYSSDITYLPNSWDIIYVFGWIFALVSELCMLAVVIRAALHHGAAEQRRKFLAIALYCLLAFLVLLAIVLIGLYGRIVDLEIHPDVTYDDDAYFVGYSPDLYYAFESINLVYFGIYLIVLLILAFAFVARRGSSQTTFPFLSVAALALLVILTVLGLAQAAASVDLLGSDSLSDGTNEFIATIAGPINLLQTMVLLLLGGDLARRAGTAAAGGSSSTSFSGKFRREKKAGGHNTSSLA